MNLQSKIIDAFSAMVAAFDVRQGATPDSAIGKARTVLAALKSIPSLRPFDDDESNLFPGASNLPGNLPPEIAYVTLDSHNGPGAIEVDCTVILAGYDSENPYTVSVYDDSPDLVAVVGFRSKDDAVAFANFILYGSITVDGVRGFGCSV